MLAEEVGWNKILVTALVSSFFTACVTEPIKGWIAGWRKRPQMKRYLHSEVAANFAALQRVVESAKHNSDLRAFIGDDFRKAYRRTSFDSAVNDASTFYELGPDWIYWLDFIYGSFERVATGSFDNDVQRLRNADFVAEQLLFLAKNRYLSLRLLLRASPEWMRQHLRDNLPSTRYTDVMVPSRMERVRRRIDRFQYWSWSKLHGTKKERPYFEEELRAHPK